MRQFRTVQTTCFLFLVSLLPAFPAPAQAPAGGKAKGGGKFRVVACAVGRAQDVEAGAQRACAGGTSENSPAFQRWDQGSQEPSREATVELGPRTGRPFGTYSAMSPDPALKRWAIVESPSGTELLRTGTVSVADKLVRFIRPGVVEEYSVSMDGVRQDFVVMEKPAGEGDKLYGSVTAMELSEALRARGIEIDRKKLELPGAIKRLGEYEIKAKLGREISAEFKLVVRKQE